MTNLLSPECEIKISNNSGFHVTKKGKKEKETEMWKGRRQSAGRAISSN
jgi:hypothetical protein